MDVTTVAPLLLPLLPVVATVVATTVARQLPAAAASESVCLHAFSNAARNRATAVVLPHLPAVATTVATMVVLPLLHAVVTMVALVSSKLLQLHKMLPLKLLAKMLPILRHRSLILRLPVPLSVADRKSVV